ncbi:unnamed protein product, partial [Adineta ricciae]
MLETKKEILHKFRFHPSNELIQLTQQQLIRLPLLNKFVENKTNFPLLQNDRHEYVLHHPIRFPWFIPLFHSINTQQPHVLFTELTIDENIFDVLQLFDYLCVDLFPSPLLDERNLRSLNPTKNTDRNRRLVYRPVKNVGEARTLAAQFILSLSRDEYDLNDFRTIESVFSLISVIFTRRDIFNSQFRYHTYTILDKCVFPLFFKRHPMEVLINIDEDE